VAVTIEAIFTRFEELGITPIVRDGELLLQAPKGAITDQCRRIVAERKEEIIAYLTDAPIREYEWYGMPVVEYCWGTMTIQPAGYTLAQHIENLKAEQKAKKRITHCI
jgi:TubC N-terminal docking domain